MTRNSDWAAEAKRLQQAIDDGATVDDLMQSVATPGKRAKLTKASQIKPERQKWFYKIDGEGVQPSKVCTMFAGIGGEGKSTFALHQAALLSRGQLEGDFFGEKHATIIFGPEDDWATVHVPRLIAAGADLDLIYQLTAEVIEEDFTGERDLKFPLDTKLLEEAVIETGAKLIIVDPISSAMQGDMNKVQDVRTAVGPLDALAKKYDLAVTLINHFKKGGSSIAEKSSGSHGFRDIVRSYLAFATNEETNERILTQDKNNYGTGFGSWKFTLQGHQIQTDEGPTEAPAVLMLGASDVTVNDLIDRDHTDQEDDRKDWESWLIEVLTEAGGSMEVKEIEKAANAIGFNFKRIQKDRSKVKNPRIETGRDGFGKGAKYIWKIEESPMDSTETTMHSMHSIDTSARETMESMESMTPKPESMHAPSTKPSCQQHGTHYAVSICLTCRGLAKETA